MSLVKFSSCLPIIQIISSEFLRFGGFYFKHQTKLTEKIFYSYGINATERCFLKSVYDGVDLRNIVRYFPKS